MAETGTIKIEGVGTFSGEWPIDPSSFTNRELHMIKQIANVRAGELEEAFESEDNDLIVALAAVALHRAGHTMSKQAVDALWDATVGKITLIIEGDDADVPPAEQSPSRPGSSESGADKPASSGPSGNGTGDFHPESDRSSTGTQGSATGADSAPVTLET